MSQPDNATVFLEKVAKRRMTFMLVGKTGVGKSSTINSLLGCSLAKVSHYDPGTLGVHRHVGKVSGVETVVYDTPGLCDSKDDQVNDEYIRMIVKEVRNLSCMLLVARMDEFRLVGDDQRIIQTLAKRFNPVVWKHTVVVLTFAGNIRGNIDEYERHFADRARSIKEEIGRYVKDREVVAAIPVVAVDNCSECTPDGKKWLGELHVCVARCLRGLVAITFLSATAGRLAAGTPDFSYAMPPQPAVEQSNRQDDAPVLGKFVHQIELNSVQRELLWKTIDAKLPATLGAAGASIGVIFGPVGATVGGAVGATAGVIVALWRRNRGGATKEVASS